MVAVFVLELLAAGLMIRGRYQQAVVASLLAIAALGLLLFLHMTDRLVLNL